MTIILDGKALAQATEKNLAERVKALKQKKGFVPLLATILVGSDPASETYVKMKGNACERIGMNSLKVELSEETSTEKLLEKIKELNNDPKVHGILLQHPVPHNINERKCFDAINLIRGISVISAEAILNAGTSREYNKSTLSLSNGVEKHIMSFFLEYSKISCQLSFVRPSNLLNTSN